jgi:hypothetical protein
MPDRRNPPLSVKALRNLTGGFFAFVVLSLAEARRAGRDAAPAYR